jgi:hypothetical protein
MLLNLSVGGNILAAVPLDPKRWKDQQYVHRLCQMLAKKNRTAIEALQLKPTYYIEVPSRMKKAELRRSPGYLYPEQLN